MKSIRFKLWAGMMALVVIVLILLWLFQIVFLGKFYTKMHISDVKNEALSIIKVLNNSNKNEYENKLYTFANKNNASVDVLDKVGNTIYMTGATGTSANDE